MYPDSLRKADDDIRNLKPLLLVQGNLIRGGYGLQFEVQSVEPNSLRRFRPDDNGG